MLELSLDHGYFYVSNLKLLTEGISEGVSDREYFEVKNNMDWYKEHKIYKHVVEVILKEGTV